MGKHLEYSVFYGDKKTKQEQHEDDNFNSWVNYTLHFPVYMY